MNSRTGAWTIGILRAILGTGLAVWICTLTAVPNAKAAESNAKTLDPPLTVSQVVRRMVETNRWRTEALRSYTSVRSYHLELHGLIHKQADMKVKMTYQWPGKKDFKILSQSGSAFMRKHVLKRLIEAENEASGRREHRQASITPQNYNFQLAGYEQNGQGEFYILKAVAKAKRKFLFDGRIWVNARNFAIMRIEGQPAKTLSWWTTKVNFVYKYKKFGQFWLPALNETRTHVRIFGRSLLTIRFKDYDLNDALNVKSSVPVKLLLSDQSMDSVLTPPSAPGE